MRNFIFTLSLLSYVACTETSEPLQTSGVPISVSSIQMDIVGNSLVRIIQHNMEHNPIVQLEIMSQPELKVLSILTIKEIPYQDEVLSFKNSAGIYVEEIKLEQDYINMVFDYFYLQGGSVLVSCNLPVENSTFAELQCFKK